MLRNYFKIAWRNLIKNKFSSFINISGLAVGIAVALLNCLWVWDELSFNKYHENYDRVAKVTHRGLDSEGKPYANSTIQYPMADELKNVYPQYFDHILLSAEADDYIL
ncbi:MAG: ABC transporter permease, partial [Chitinophagaceae bacterium]